MLHFLLGLYSEYGFEERLTKIELEFPGANVMLHKMGHQPPVRVDCAGVIQVYE